MAKDDSVIILGTRLQLINYLELKSIILDSIENIFQINLIACDFRQIKYFYKSKICSDGLFCYPDSSGIFIILKMFHFNKTKYFRRLVSTNFHSDILNIGNEKKMKIYLLGDKTEILELFISKITNKYKNLNVVGFSNGYEDLEEENIFSKINGSGADILLIGMGVPKQELWLIENSSKIKIPIRVTVGAFFTFYSGRINRAPKIFSKLYLEWFYRLLKEPKRLFPRYFLEFPKTLILIIIDKWKK